MTRIPAEWCLPLLLLLTAGAVMAEENASEADEHPSMELLEFLGGFETPEGEWLDPMMLVGERERQQDEVVGDDD
jgi:hypothetical protein